MAQEKDEAERHAEEVEREQEAHRKAVKQGGKRRIRFEFTRAREEMGTAIRIGKDRGGKTLETAEPLVFQEHRPTPRKPIPEVLVISDEDLQRLMDSLWCYGVRPKPYTFSSDHINKAMEAEKLLEAHKQHGNVVMDQLDIINRMQQTMADLKFTNDLLTAQNNALRAERGEVDADLEG